jgi:hypothetical protein
MGLGWLRLVERDRVGVDVGDHESRSLDGLLLAMDDRRASRGGVRVRGPTPLRRKVVGLVGHDFALARIVRILVTVRVAVVPAIFFGEDLLRFSAALRLFATLVFSVALPFLSAGLEGFMFVLQNRVGTLELCHGHLQWGSCCAGSLGPRDLESVAGHG